ncbi:hypothetical protein [Amorphus sp. 3PC139-8]|uniref:hypothetical protein n=1 Tax=Amorphus sp. 3PC139-8 TaxID=2735676 RepID=UPI00345DA30C
MDYTNAFNDIVRAQAEARRELDFADSQRELAGVEVGRIGRFLSPEAREALREGKSGGSRSGSSMSALDWMLLNDPAYAQAYEGAMNALADAESAVDRALEQALERAETAQSILDETLDNAMKLPDGTAVFMDAEGTVRTEDGEAIDTVLAAALEWQGNEPSYETFVEQRDGLVAANDAVADIRRDQVELGDIRAELTDRDNPPSKERVDALRDRAEKIETTYDEGHDPAPVDQSHSIRAVKPEVLDF